MAKLAASGSSFSCPSVSASATATLAVAALIAGNLVGAGILGLPINTGLAGLGPSLLAMVAGAALMFLTAVILGDQAARAHSENFDYPSLYERFLGQIGKWIAIIANLIILYGLLTAYFTGGAKIVAGLIGWESQQTLVTLLCALPLVGLSSVKLGLIERFNTLLVGILVLAFSSLILIGAGHVAPPRLAHADWLFLPATLPIIVTAFHFHNIIPTVTTTLGGDQRRFHQAVLGGMLLAFVMNALWVLVGTGVIPLTGEHSILEAYEQNIPATLPMGMQIQSAVFTLIASFFALTAISTSFLANGLGLQSFVRDLLANSFGLRQRWLVLALTFAPPLLIALIFPDIFLVALDVVGGIGIVVLFGLLPTLIVLRDATRPGWLRGLCLLGFVFALGILGLEIMQEAGLLALHPNVEYHTLGSK